MERLFFYPLWNSRKPFLRSLIFPHANGRSLRLPFNILNARNMNGRNMWRLRRTWASPGTRLMRATTGASTRQDSTNERSLPLALQGKWLGLDGLMTTFLAHSLRAIHPG